MTAQGARLLSDQGTLGHPRIVVRLGPAYTSTLTENENTELLKLIRNEIDLGFTFMETYRLSSSADHSYQALAGARTALKTARRFLQGLANEAADAFEPELQQLENLVREASA